MTPTLRNSYADELPGMYLAFRGGPFPAPKIALLNRPLAVDLGFDPDDPALASLLVGMAPPVGAKPLAMAYAGHQFGGFSPSLGDGRAMLLAEVLDSRGRLYDIHLKGSGRTPFSRGADGKAAFGPMLREYLMGAAMAALEIPTTRALAVTLTGEQVLRDQGLLPGAVLARIGSSHLRVGTFQYFAARGEVEQLRRLLAYAIARHDADLDPANAIAFLGRVARRQARLIAQWMGVGFVHGVMNTDNMAISGETIDYGPCAFVDIHDPAAVFSSIDHQGRYAFGNQPAIARWNIARLAEALLPLIDGDEDRAIARAMEVIDAFPDWYEAEWMGVITRKLGLARPNPGLAKEFETLVAGADHTLAFRSLAKAAEGDATALLTHIPNAVDWLARWQAQHPDPGLIRVANPVYIPRNHLVEQALDAATRGDMAPFESLLAALAAPMTERQGLDRYALPAPSGFGAYRTFCGT